MKIEQDDKGPNFSQAYKKWFEKTYENYFERLLRFAFTIVKDHQSAEDVVSEVFMDLWKMGIGSSGIKELDSYLFVSVKNRAIRLLTRNPFRFEPLDFERTLKRIDKLTPEHLIIERELLNKIQYAVDSLPEQCRLVYELVKIRQMSYSEAAIELGVAESTIRNQIIKALKKMRLAVEDYLDEGTGFLREIL